MSTNNRMLAIEVFVLALGICARFKCKGIAKKPNAQSWAIEQDFIAGVEAGLKLCGRAMHPIIKHLHGQKRSITTLTFKEIKQFEDLKD